MAWTVYAIRSLVRNYTYVGLTSNLQDRLDRHNRGRERTTRPYRPFMLLYSEVDLSRAEARTREKFFKSGSGREFLKKLLNQVDNDHVL